MFATINNKTEVKQELMTFLVLVLVSFSQSKTLFVATGVTQVHYFFRRRKMAEFN